MTNRTRAAQVHGHWLFSVSGHAISTASMALCIVLVVLIGGASLSWWLTPDGAVRSSPAAQPAIQDPVPPPSPVVTPSGPTIETGVAMLPPMGWNGFNHFHLAVNATTVEAAARAMVSSGMKAAGYTYVNLDGGWNLRWRSAGGALVADPTKFPRGIKNLADYVHSLGLKFGIYASAGVANCAGTSAGSYGHYRPDAALFASWGVDYLKLDWCRIPYRNFSNLGRQQVNQLLATQMGDALTATGRLMVYDVNDTTSEAPVRWERGPGNVWRTTKDAEDTYQSMLLGFSHNVGRYKQAGRGSWNDPDMLEIGNGGMSLTEYQSEFSLWAEMAAPLIAGNDLTRMSAVTRGILTNQAVIAVDQDPLGRQGYPVDSAGGHWVLVKPLVNGDRAVVLFNQTGAPATISAQVRQLGFARAAGYSLVDLWSGSVTETAGVLSAVVPAHGVVMYRVIRSVAWGSRTSSL